MKEQKKPKRGAPKKQPDKAKVALLQIRLSTAEKEAFAIAAELDGKKISEWIRDRLRRDSRQELEASSALSSLNFGVKSLQFHPGVFDAKLPIDPALFCVRPLGPSLDFRLQFDQLADSTVAQALTR